jgi:predicted dehydrogenase
MSAEKLKTAVLGINEVSEAILDCLSKIDYYQISAIADTDTKKAQKTASKYKCSYYDDYRQFIIQNEFDCLIAAAPLHRCTEHIKFAIKKKFNILKTPPMAQDFEQASALKTLAEKEKIKFAVINPYRFAQSFVDFSQSIQKYKNSIFLININRFCKRKTEQNTWQTDKELAGGGVILYDCYQIIDRIIEIFGLPEQVYSLNTNKAPDRKQRYYLTEDTALLTMKFSDTTFAHLTTSNRLLSDNEKETIELYSNERIFSVSPRHLTISSEDSTVISHNEFKDTQAEWLWANLNNFALSILSPQQNRLISSAKENLCNMALIESAYLSARTAMPEQPDKILQLTKPPTL